MALRFGLQADEARRLDAHANLIPDLPDTGILCLAGPSGSGKSSALNAIARRCPAARRVDLIHLQSDSAVIEQVAPWAGLEDAAGLLAACGVGEPRLWLRRPDCLSDGERFRVRLAVALAEHRRDAVRGTPPPLLCDEFAATLHRRLARALAFNLRKLATRWRLRLVLAAAQDDLLHDLNPDVTLRLHGDHRSPTVEHRPALRRRAFSLRRRLRILEGTKRDYEPFAAMHYRATDELGFVDKVFVLREGREETPLGVIVYAHAPLELRLRNLATGGYFRRRPDRVNAELRIIRRIVIRPDVRGCGLGHHLIRRTLPLVGVDFVEAQAALGEFHPVFQRAGMRRVGQVEWGRRRAATLDALHALDADPGDADFASRACRDRRLRDLVQRAIRRWYAATTGGGRARDQHQSPERRAHLFRGIVAARPVYYLWTRRKTPKPEVTEPAGNGEPEGTA